MGDMHEIQSSDDLVPSKDSITLLPTGYPVLSLSAACILVITRNSIVLIEKMVDHWDGSPEEAKTRLHASRDTEEVNGPSSLD